MLNLRYVLFFSSIIRVLTILSVGNLRFNLPQPIEPYNGTLSVTAFGLACPQQVVDLPILTGLAQEVVDYIANSIYGTIFPDSEDCLTINVVKPASATPGSNLPVAVVRRPQLQVEVYETSLRT